MIKSKRVYTTHTVIERNTQQEKEIPGRCRVRGCPWPAACPDHAQEDLNGAREIEALMRHPTGGTRRLRG